MRRTLTVLTLAALLAAAVLEPVGPKAPSLPWTAWEDGGREAIAQARGGGRPTLVFVTASWDCAAKELSYVTFSDPRVMRTLERFAKVVVDVSDDESPVARNAIETLRVKGTPTVIVLDASGNEVARLHEFVRPEEMLRLLELVRGGSPSQLGAF